MAKFLIETTSPDLPIKKEEIEKAMLWMTNHDGTAFRCFIKVTEIEKDYRLKDSNKRRHPTRNVFTFD